MAMMVFWRRKQARKEGKKEEREVRRKVGKEESREQDGFFLKMKSSLIWWEVRGNSRWVWKKFTLKQKSGVYVSSHEDWLNGGGEGCSWVLIYTRTQYSLWEERMSNWTWVTAGSCQWINLQTRACTRDLSPRTNCPIKAKFSIGIL